MGGGLPTLGLSVFPHTEVQPERGDPRPPALSSARGLPCAGRGAQPCLLARLLLGSLAPTPAGGGHVRALREPVSTALLGVWIREAPESCTLQRRPEPWAPVSLGLAPGVCPPPSPSRPQARPCSRGHVTGHPDLSCLPPRERRGGLPGVTGHPLYILGPSRRSATVLFLRAALFIEGERERFTLVGCTKKRVSLAFLCGTREVHVSEESCV